MKIAMISCEAYRDCWLPFAKLFDRYWTNCRFAMDVISDGPRRLSWCQALSDYAGKTTEPILLLQEDFLFDAPVQIDLVEHGLRLLESTGAGCVRLHPMPGGDTEFGDPFFRLVDRAAPYRVSCQVGIWDPKFLWRIAHRLTTPADFELTGTEISRSMPEMVLAFKREIHPWPLSYICTGIVGGQWDPAAKRLCEREGITGVDWTRRPFLAEPRP